MCRSKDHGGRRCPQTPSVKAANSIRAQLSRARRKQDANKEAELQERLENLKAAQEKYGSSVSYFDLPLPQEISNLFTVLQEGGGNPLLVGGTVRDALSSKVVPKDFDIEVHEQSMDGIARTLRRNGFHVDMVGRQFGVIKTRVGDEEIDISIPRKDSLSGSGHRGFTVETNENMGIEEAAARRDFTINAMMYDPATKAVIDPYNGREDLKEGTLRHVSEAFGEDPLRPLRGFQFASRYGLTMAPETAEVCQELQPRAGEISKERIQTEWDKFFSKSTQPSAGITVLKQMNWDSTVPAADKINPQHLDNAVAVRKNASPQDRGTLVAAVAMSNMSPKEAKKFGSLTIMGDRPKNKAIALAMATAPQELDRPTLRKWTRELRSRKLTVQDWADKQNATEADKNQTASIVSATKKHGVFDNGPSESLAGKDLIELFPDRKPGPWVGKLLREGLEAEDKGVFTNNADARKWALKNAPALQG